MDYALSFAGNDDTSDESSIRWSFDEESQHQCPGFCGRVSNETAHVDIASSEFVLSSCQACPWGFFADANSLCVKCTVPLRIYDYYFFIFHALVPLLVHALFLKIYTDFRFPVKRTRLWLAVQVSCAAVESILAVALALLVLEPRGSLVVIGCPTPSHLCAWYPALFDPVIDYRHQLACAHEVVYPLFFLPFVILAFCLVNAAILRPFLYVLARHAFHVRLHSAPFYATCWSLPLCALAHIILSGVLYHSFPYLCIFVSLVVNATHLALEGRRGVRQMFVLLVSREHVEYAALIIAHMALLGFGAIAIAAADGLPSWPALALIGIMLPAPTCFYVLTIRLTAPQSRISRHRR